MFFQIDVNALKEQIEAKAKERTNQCIAEQYPSFEKEIRESYCRQCEAEENARTHRVLELQRDAERQRCQLAMECAQFWKTRQVRR